MKTRVIKVPAVQDKLGFHVKSKIPFDYVVLEYSKEEGWIVIRLFGDDNILNVKGEEVTKSYPRIPHRIIDKNSICTDSDNDTEIGKEFRK